MVSSLSFNPWIYFSDVDFRISSLYTFVPVYSLRTLIVLSRPLILSCSRVATFLAFVPIWSLIDLMAFSRALTFSVSNEASFYALFSSPWFCYSVVFSRVSSLYELDPACLLMASMFFSKPLIRSFSSEASFWAFVPMCSLIDFRLLSSPWICCSDVFSSVSNLY